MTIPCPSCERTFKNARGVNIHRSRHIQCSQKAIMDRESFNFMSLSTNVQFEFFQMLSGTELLIIRNVLPQLFSTQYNPQWQQLSTIAIKSSVSTEIEPSKWSTLYIEYVCKGNHDYLYQIVQNTRRKRLKKALKLGVNPEIFTFGRDYIYDDNCTYNLEEVVSKCQHEYTRKSELVHKLAEIGCRLRSDSKLCAQWISDQLGPGWTLEKTVDMCAEMKWLYNHTPYKKQLDGEVDEIIEASNRSYEWYISRYEAFTQVEPGVRAKILKTHPKPEKWPWKPLSADEIARSIGTK